MSLFGILTKLQLANRVNSCLKQTKRAFKQKPQNCKQNLNMNIIYFRHKSEEKKIEVNFRYINKAFGIDRVFNLSRNEDEKIEVCLGRVQTNVSKELGKKFKKQKKKAVKKGTVNEDDEDESQLV